ncbi:hypothetical protein [Ideonella sp. BN130291]|uniref:hypothetical protein n=1 Tax=Ideonella sp. BN130291 TaxID=3112940 RepID=UPI002E270378|nr:hypothetical protein [Ideonella sp. BN130291]
MQNRLAVALAFYAGPEVFDTSLVSETLALGMETLSSVGLRATHAGLLGGGHSGKYRKLTGAFSRSLSEGTLEGITSLTLASVPAGSDAPAFDGVAAIGVTALGEETILFCVVETTHVALFSQQYEVVAARLASLRPWSFGYGFTDRFRHAELHILAMDPGDLSPEESVRLNAWYQAGFNARTTKLRNVYPDNYLNGSQLEAIAAPGTTLRQFASRQAGTTLQPVTASTLVRWTIPDDARLRGVRADLAHSNLIIR